MALKPRYKRRIIWSIVSVVAALALAFIIAPTFITMNNFKPMIEKSITEQTNVPAKINGDIHFSLLSGAKIVAHDVNVPTARIGSVMLSIPFRSLFNLKSPKLESTVTIYDANIDIEKLVPATFNHTIYIYNSDIHYMGRDFHIVRAQMVDNKFNGIIRTKDHKYFVEFYGDKFHITNQSNKLDIIGQFFSDGSLRGHMSLETDNINSWFNVPEPKINQTVNLTMDFEWNSENGFKYTNIQSGHFDGEIEIHPNGNRTIKMNATNLDFDLSFLLTPGRIKSETKYNIDFYGDLKLMDKKIKHLKINAIGTPDLVQITNIIADDIAITGGTITADGAKNLMLNMQLDGIESTCVFSGTPDKWQCSPYTYGDFHGDLSVDGDKFDIAIISDKKMPSNEIIANKLKKLGTHGKVNFQFQDVTGSYEFADKPISPIIKSAKNKTLKWLKISLPFLPEFMNNDHGDFTLNNNTLEFVPHNKQWSIDISGKHFVIRGLSAHTWVPNLDLRSVKDMPYTISGTYDNGQIADLTIELNGHKFTGSVTNKNITLHTDLLNLDMFISPDFITRYQELEFLTNAPILIPFGLPVNLSLSANKLIYDNHTLDNFVYSLKDNAQVFSISDKSRGNMLTTIEKDKTKYEIFIQLNKFVFDGKLLPDTMPLNIRDTMITAEIHMNTHGQIAHDIWYNLTGEMDISLDGGYLMGMSIDNFYASADKITTLNAEYALIDMLSVGETKIKSMHIIGKYNNGDFITTQPLRLALSNTDVIGTLEITNQEMYAALSLTMRGISPEPSVINLDVLPNGKRKYSLSEIMISFDPGYLREYIKLQSGI